MRIQTYVIVIECHRRTMIQVSNSQINHPSLTPKTRNITPPPN